MLREDVCVWATILSVHERNFSYSSIFGCTSPGQKLRPLFVRFGKTYQIGYTGFRFISEVHQRRARLVLEWVSFGNTTRRILIGRYRCWPLNGDIFLCEKLSSKKSEQYQFNKKRLWFPPFLYTPTKITRISKKGKLPFSKTWIA